MEKRAESNLIGRAALYVGEAADFMLYIRAFLSREHSKKNRGYRRGEETVKLTEMTSTLTSI